MTITELTPSRRPSHDDPLATPTPVDATLHHLDRAVDTVHVGPAHPTDVENLHGFYEQLAPASRRQRFFAPMPTVPRSIAAHLCAVDPARHLVWLAREGSTTGPVVGEVQVALDAEDASRAELALAVADRWAGRGLGRSLVAIAHDLAASLGVETLTAEVLGENHRCAALLSRAGMRFTLSSGVLSGTGPVTPSGRLPATATFPARPRSLAESA